MRNQRKTVSALWIICLVSILSLALTHCERKESDIQTTGTVAFVEVSVVPMDGEHIIEGQTVIVQDGIISEIGPASKLQVPPDALKIDGRGKYLMPDDNIKAVIGWLNKHPEFRIYLWLKSSPEKKLDSLKEDFLELFRIYGLPDKLKSQNEINRSY